MELTTLEKNSAFWKSGKLGNYVIVNRKGKIFKRIYIKPKQPGTPKQLEIWEKFKNAVMSWHNLTEEEKKYYNEKVKKLKLSMTGFNYFISLYLRLY